MNHRPTLRHEMLTAIRECFDRKFMFGGLTDELRRCLRDFEVDGTKAVLCACGRHYTIRRKGLAYPCKHCSEPAMMVLVDLIQSMKDHRIPITSPYDVGNFMHDHGKQEMIFKAMDLCGIQSEVMTERENQ